MARSISRERGGVRALSLRTRWNRAFVVLTTVVVVAGLSCVVVAHLLIGGAQRSALLVERQASSSAELRNAIVEQVILLTGPMIDEQQAELDRGNSDIVARFDRALRLQTDPRARQLLQQSLGMWQALVVSVGPPGDRASLEARAASVRTLTPRGQSLLDAADTASRAAVRAESARRQRVDQLALTLLATLELFAMGLTVRLARRLSTEVLRPIGVLRDSADQLARGVLDHRVVVDRSDELGELAVSFNEMADAMAGSQRRLTIDATTDALTGLSNRAAFHAHLASLLGTPQRHSGDQGVLFLDLDDFKDVNDTLGHAAGDEVLRVVSGRLRAALRPGDFVARLGGDEFAVLLDGLTDPDAARAVAERVVRACRTPVTIGASQVHVGASVGLAIRTGSSTPDALVREADVAMYTAKGKGKNRVECYDIGQDEASAARSELRVDVHRAVERAELVLDYQPVVDLETGSIVGVEALVRWQHPTHGLLPPSQFVELAEETGAVLPIGDWVLQTAAAQLRSWQRRYGQPALSMTVNICAAQVQAHGFADHVVQTLAAAGVSPDTFVVDVTEAVLADPGGRTAECLADLRVAGLRVALDDFGTGACSITELPQLPVDILKIDRSHVSSTQGPGQGHVLLEAIVAVAQHLGLEVVAEGIETHDQLDRLRGMDCRTGQGFLLSRPVPASGIEELLTSALPLPIPQGVPVVRLVSTGQLPSPRA